MTLNPESQARKDARRKAAADWLQRLDDPALPEADLQAWLHWHGESEQNRKAFEEMQTLYRQLRDLPGDYRRELRQRFGHTEALHRRPWPKLWALAASVLLAVLCAGGAWWWQVSDPWTVAYSSPRDRHRTIRLADGSALVLAQDSLALVKFTRHVRSLTIERGEAYFDVRHDPDRPFEVQVAGVRVTAVGTAFNVARTSDRVTVTVTEGTVDVVQLSRPGAAEISSPRPALLQHRRVTKGERLVLKDALAQADRTQSSAEPAWTNGQLQFVDAPLSQVVQTVGRYARRRVMIDDPRVADLTFSGTVFRDRVDEWTTALPAIFPIQAVTLTDGSVALVLAREASTVK
ncbi:MAG TPA: FecR domain-containing protein [Burkholderiaceae bacterium]